MFKRLVSFGDIPISEIDVGDEVLAYNEATGETDSYTVTDVLVHEDPIIVYLTITGETIETTPEHPFYTTNRGWVAAIDLREGDRIRKADGNDGVVEAVEVVEQAQEMYNLTVDEAHTFFVGDGQWLVHNKCKLSKPEGLSDPDNGATVNTFRRKLQDAWNLPDEYPELNWEAHHIVPWDHPLAAEARQVLIDADINLHSTANLTWLPALSDDLVAARELFDPVPLWHRGSNIHTHWNLREINNRLKGLSDQDDILKELDTIANELSSGSLQ